jgi:RND superfamily putative drug exporter
MLGRRISRHRFVVVLLWILALAMIAPIARRAPLLLDAGSGNLAGTDSARVEDALAHDFANPFAQSLTVTFHSTTARYSDPEFQAAAASLLGELRRCPAVARAVLPDDSFGTHFRSADGHGIALLVGLKAGTVPEAEKLVPQVRQCVAAALPGGSLPGWDWQVTGRAALLYDLNLFNAADSQRAEARALPLALVVLVVVFGSLVSAALPLALGLGATLLALSVVPFLVHATPLNILYQNVATLLGLALGIDYSLFMISRYREQRAAAVCSRDEALATTMGSAGVAITYSGLTVLIGLTGLLLTPIFELRSIGLGGLMVVTMSLLLSLTLLPALLVLLDPWLGSPKKLAAALRLGNSRHRWESWTALVLRHPAFSLVVGLVFLLILSAPLLTLHPGFPDKSWMPASMEANRGIEVLRQMGQAQDLTPINLLVRARDRGPLLPAHLDAFFELSERLKSDPRVARVFGPVDLGGDLQEFQLRTLYLNFEQGLADHPELGELLFSRARDCALVQVVLKDRTGYEDSLACARRLAQLQVPGLRIEAGGQWPAVNDYDARLRAAYPVVFGFVVAATLIVLFAAFRSYLVPLKALVLNALSVSAAFGCMVAVFQWGWGSALVGLAEPAGAIPYTVPLIVFCITFGLSMDYEVLLLSRVREEFLRDRNGGGSVQRGLVATGGLISGAALLMAVVFGSFALADILVVKMLGFGLAVAVVVDAVVVRVLMVPAAMELAGRWNWFPGVK